MIKQIKNGFTAIRDEYNYRKYSPGRVLFDHLPKCAGSAIDAYLGSHYPKRLVFKTDPNQPRSSVAKFKELSTEERHRYRLVVGHMAHDLVDLVHPETTTLTILREPVDRIVSHYFYVLQQEQHYLHERVVKDNIQLEDYATLGLSDELENWYTTHFTGLTIEQVEQDPQAALEHAIDLIAEKYDIIGFQTNLPDVAERLQRAACFGDAFENALTNQTRKRLSLREISDQARQSIADANAVDVKLYTALQQRFG